MSPQSSTGSSSGRGSRPTRSWLRLASTAAATRSPNVSAATAARAPASSSCAIWTELKGCSGYRGTRIVQCGEDRALLERHDRELGRRPPQERPEQEQVLGVLGPQRGLGGPGGGEAGADLERRA